MYPVDCPLDIAGAVPIDGAAVGLILGPFDSIGDTDGFPVGEIDGSELGVFVMFATLGTTGFTGMEEVLIPRGLVTGNVHIDEHSLVPPIIHNCPCGGNIVVLLKLNRICIGNVV